MSYELNLESYKGPLEKLLELIEEKKLEITQISLAEVTADFLKYIKVLGEAIEKKEGVPSNNLFKGLSPVILADFLVIASKLILIKSKFLLPSLILNEEEESDIKNLEARLRIYQEFKGAQKNLKSLWSENPVMLSREFLFGVGPVFFPPAGLKKEDLGRSLISIIDVLEKTFKPVVKIKNEILNLKRKIEEVLKRVTEKPTRFGNLNSGGSREGLIVLFLAILHLIKDQLIYAEQGSHFEEIFIVKGKKID